MNEAEWRRLFVHLTTPESFGSGEVKAGHPLLEKTGIWNNGRERCYNDLFRAVHDYFGQAVEGNQFGPAGEERAWLKHVSMFSPLAVKAMTSETRGQNSWVNFGPHMWDEDGWRGDQKHPDICLQYSDLIAPRRSASCRASSPRSPSYHQRLCWRRTPDSRFHASPQKIKAFLAWVAAQIGQTVTSTNSKELWDRYIPGCRFWPAACSSRCPAVAARLSGCTPPA
jgi:hypothetical protein